jgi:hypothetical protein
MWDANSSFVVSLLNQTFINFQRSKKCLIHWIVKKGKNPKKSQDFCFKF